MKLALVMIATIIVAVLIAACGRYYIYVTNTASPYDEVGIALNGYMPGPVRTWGCGRLKDTFGKKTLPPLGCEGADGKTWL